MNIQDIEPGHCQCGCGQRTNVSRYNDPKNGWVKGQPRRFLVGHEARLRGRADYTGQKFGRWTVVSFSHFTKRRAAYWLCRCECGSERAVNVAQLKNGTNRSCGCLQRELASAKSFKHGLSRHPLRPAYQQMKARCYNPNSPEYPNYGGRGIVVCERWRESFANFLADVGERPEGCTLDRIDNNGSYSPENCRWATVSEQCNNTRVNHVLEYNGQRKTVVEWAREIGVHPNTLRSRLRYGWSTERILSSAVDTRCHHKSQ